MPKAKLPHPQGKPCWADLMATDQDAALDFYGTLFGWTGEKGGPEFGGYAVMHVGDAAAAGIGPQMPGAAPSPPAWTVYFAVDGADAAAARIAEHGGKVLFGPHDIPGTGRTAVAADPGGAVFGIWQPTPFPGFGVEEEPGAAVWFERDGRQGAEAAAFYSAVLQVPAAPMEEMPDAYWLLTVDGAQAAGIWKNDEADGARWQVYFEVADADVAVAGTTGRGGRLIRPAHDSPYGRVAALADPQGAQFVVMSRSRD